MKERKKERKKEKKKKESIMDNFHSSYEMCLLGKIQPGESTGGC